LKKVLFVDDESNVLNALRRVLRGMRGEWMTKFASNGKEARQLLSEHPFDVLVTDIRMPLEDGIELLKHTVQHYPQIVRIVLSGTADQEMTLRSVSLAHQYLMKPCNAETLIDTLENALSLRIILDDPPLTALLGRLRSLPSVPTVYLKLMEILKSNESSASEIGALISRDLGMSAKILQWVNSPLFGFQRTIGSPTDAVAYLGLQTVKALALSESVFSQFNSSNTPGFSVEALRQHSYQVALAAQWIARTARLDQSVMDDVFLGGLMHDIGKLVLGSNFPAKYCAVAEHFDEPAECLAHELKIFRTTHAEVGGYLLWLWGLPKTVTEIVVRHHSAGPETADVRDPAGVVNLADRLVREGPKYATGLGIDLPSFEVRT